MSRGWLVLQRSRTLVERNKNQLCHYMATQLARIAGIRLPGGIVTQFALESFGICRFRGSCIERIQLNLINLRV